MVTPGSLELSRKQLKLLISFGAVFVYGAFSSLRSHSHESFITETSIPRSLSEVVPHSIYPWAKLDLIPVEKPPSSSHHETAIFWHIPKSGGTTIKHLYKCFGVSVADKFGAHIQHHEQDTEIISFQPWPKKSRTTYVNVDVSNKEGILHASALGLVPSDKADIIITTKPEFAVGMLFDKSHRGRFLILVREPIDRLVSLFYYLQVATWEVSYRPDWKKLSLLDWSQKHAQSWRDFLVKKIMGKDQFTEEEFEELKETVRKYFVVGLMNEMEESVNRFNAAMGINEKTTEYYEPCMSRFFWDHHQESGEAHNSNEHPKLLEGSPEWNILAEQNSYDMRLYEFMIELFEEQKDALYSYQ
mmetsp:Transcript_25075/g.52752  ORF Transcript_25075/g.52752 Transcript_25075/m.52752 type:complete len:358 (+) Transcript_25075:62-1135(+)